MSLYLYMYVFVIFLLFIGIYAITAINRRYNRLLDFEKMTHEMHLKHEMERHTEQMAKNELIFEIEKRELTQRHTKILDEISQVTGIDVVELPSFGTINLNHSKTVREAMKALYEEDESDGVYD